MSIESLSPDFKEQKMSLAEAISKRKGTRDTYAKLVADMRALPVSRTYEAPDVPEQQECLHTRAIMLMQNTALVLVNLDNAIDAANVRNGNMKRINEIHYLKQEAAALQALPLSLKEEEKDTRREREMSDHGTVATVRITTISKRLFDAPAMQATLADIKNKISQLNLEIDRQNIRSTVSINLP